VNHPGQAAKLLFLMSVWALGSAVGMAQSAPAPGQAAALVLTPTFATAVLTNSAGPRIQFDSTNYDFGRVMSGEPVKHVFTFTNTGNRELVLGRVYAGCACSKVGEWTAQVKPGGVGTVSAELNTLAVEGNALSKTISVTCNDETRPGLALQFKGAVWRPIGVSPELVVLNLKPDAAFASALVQITNRREEPLLLSPPESTNTAFGAELRTNLFGRAYTLLVSNTIPLPGGVAQALFTLKTSLTNPLQLNILAVANVSPAITTEPGSVRLPSGPLGTNLVVCISILNNSTNAMRLSELTVSEPGVDFVIKETRPGSLFTATLAFPAGFKLPEQQTVWLTFRSSLPQAPLVKVPITQSPGPPVAPRLNPPGLATAPMPLVFQSEALASLDLGEEQQEELDELRRQFIQEVGGTGQNPVDSSYLERWQKAQAMSDKRIARVVGRQAMAGLESMVTPAESGGN
jgi:hypothetical protein